MKFVWDLKILKKKKKNQKEKEKDEKTAVVTIRKVIALGTSPSKNPVAEGGGLNVHERITRGRGPDLQNLDHNKSKSLRDSL